MSIRRPITYASLPLLDRLIDDDPTSQVEVRPGCELRLMPSVSAVSGVPSAGKSLIILAVVGQALHFRIFDDDGKIVVDADEKSLRDKSRPIESLKRQLESLWPPHRPSAGERARVNAMITSIVGYSFRPGRAEVDRAVREGIRRDLEVLLSTRQRMLVPPAGADELDRSAIDFGLPASRGAELTSPRGREDLRARIEAAIVHFEPRLRDVRVALEPDDEPAGLLHLSIGATLVDTGELTGPIAFRAAVEARSGRLAVEGAEA